MAVYSLKTVQQIPAPLEQVWAFFSKPDNLKNITPPQLNFNVISTHQGDSIYAGQIIEYKVSPVPGIPLYWMTEITHLKDGVYFVDEQRYGPYSMWHHQHHFKAIDGGVEMTDIVHYKIPLWFLGTIANALFVRSRLKSIFGFRYQKTAELFGSFVDDKPLLAFGR